MKKFLFLILVIAAAVLAFLYFTKGNGPSAVAEKYIVALQKGDYKTALDYTALDEKTKEQYVSILSEKGGNGLEDKNVIESYKIMDETIDKEAGTATVSVKLTHADGHETEHNVPLVKGPDGNWLVKDVK